MNPLPSSSAPLSPPVALGQRRTFGAELLGPCSVFTLTPARKGGGRPVFTQSCPTGFIFFQRVTKIFLFQRLSTQQLEFPMPAWTPQLSIAILLMPLLQSSLVVAFSFKPLSETSSLTFYSDTALQWALTWGGGRIATGGEGGKCKCIFLYVFAFFSISHFFAFLHILIIFFLFSGACFFYFSLLFYLHFLGLSFFSPFFVAFSLFFSEHRRTN